ncbi:hypothetical protein RHSIM_Rhsim13G0080700 [Rhododendron simsii]|uniref:Aminotransferase-like plant mobile domain-containing protein n=1 Tax=Rhododendron simsii TaxID=118357 RepID=A0A834FZ30_RHOSS|nr:hypothetical protein RHSIM_Rhsim13G0080700 [Rhododendron simsii]
MPKEADLIPFSSVLRVRVERGDIPSCFINYEATSQAPVHWRDLVEVVLVNPNSVQILRASRSLEPVRLFVELSIRKNNTNIDLMVFRWSKDTHTFMFPWGDGGPTFQDSAVLMRLSIRGAMAFDSSNLSSADARLVDRLRRAYTEAGKYGSRFNREGCIRAPPKSGKTSRGCWLSSTKSWGKRIDDFGRFFPHSYAEPVNGALLTNFLSEDERIVDFQTEGAVVPAFALSASAAACPCSIPALCAEGARSVLYCPDGVVRQFGYDQGAPGLGPPLKSYIESIRCFTGAFMEELSAGYEIVILPKNDRETFMANNCLAWRRNLDSFINYVRGDPVVLAVLDVYYRDISLGSPKARQGGAARAAIWLRQTPPPPPPQTNRGITITEPISTYFHRGFSTYFLLQGAPTRSARTPCPEEAPLNVASTSGFFTFIFLLFTHCFIVDLSHAFTCLADPSFKYEGGKHTPLSKLKRKRKDAEPCMHKEGSDSNIDDSILIRGFNETGSNAEGSDDHGDEKGEDSDVNVGSEDHNDDDGDGEDHSGDDDGGEEHNGDDNDGGGEDDNDCDADNSGADGNEGNDGDSDNDRSLDVNKVQLEVEEDKKDDDVPGLIPCHKTLTDGFLTVPDVNQLAPEAVIQQQSLRVTEVAVSLFNRRNNVPPTDDFSTHFQAYDIAMALANLNSAKVFADIQVNSLISLGTLEEGYAASDVGERSSLLAGGSVLRHQDEAGMSHG